jgi:hypothetical protein
MAKLGATPDIMINNTLLITLKKLEDITKKSQTLATIQQRTRISNMSLCFTVEKKECVNYT